MELYENKTYHVKLVRIYYPIPKLIWEGRVTFHIQRRLNGDLGVLAIKDNKEWAEYCQENEASDGVFISEDYQMIISN